jgi:lysophospholipase L1-like esterase
MKRKRPNAACSRITATVRSTAIPLLLATCAAFMPSRPLAAEALFLPIKLDFGTGATAPGYRQVLPEMRYSAERGFGFEPGATITAIDRERGDPMRRDFCTGDEPFFFSVALPEGNYRVTVTLGDATAATDTTIKAELRRLALRSVITRPGQFVRRSFIVNVRRPGIRGGGEVRLKDRERTLEAWAWDEKLTLEINGSRPALCGLEIERADDVPTVFLLGDSTVCDQPREPYASWGQMVTAFFKPTLAVANHAESGESTASSLAAGRLDKIESLLRRGDYLIIQYGHNDEKQGADKAFTSFKVNLKRFVAVARRHGATPVLVTSMHRRTFGPDGKIQNSHGEFPEAVRQAAREEGVALIDLLAMSQSLYEALGLERSAVLFKEGDATHHDNYGAEQLARCVLSGLKANRLPLAKRIIRGALPYDPSRPDPVEGYRLPPSPAQPDVRPEGS